MFLVCHMILQGHIIKEPYDFMGGSSSWLVTSLPSLLATGILVAEILDWIRLDSIGMLYFVLTKS